jgi:hypothetical protein
MGLDNGLILRNKENVIKVPKWVYLIDKRDNKTNEVEFCYWRRQYGIRGDIFDIICPSEELAEYNVTADNLREIKIALIKYLDKSYFKENILSSFWNTWEEGLPWLLRAIIAICWAERYMRKHPEAECYFYDSY